VLPLLALPLISIHNIAGGSDPYCWGLFYVVLICPLLVVSYALPLIVLPNHPLWSISSTLYAVPVCGLVAESVAWAISRAAHAQQALSDSEARLRDMAHHDALTGLSNRADFLLQLDAALDHARVADDRVALLFTDIDDFKKIKDRLGHAAGDGVVGRRIDH